MTKFNKIKKDVNNITTCRYELDKKSMLNTACQLIKKENINNIIYIEKEKISAIPYPVDIYSFASSICSFAKHLDNWFLIPLAIPKSKKIIQLIKVSITVHNPYNSIPKYCKEYLTTKNADNNAKIL